MESHWSRRKVSRFPIPISRIGAREKEVPHCGIERRTVTADATTLDADPYQSRSKPFNSSVVVFNTI